MDKLPQKEKREQRAVPPFLFLSDILARYGTFEVISTVAHGDGNAEAGTVRGAQISFCCFLASKLQGAEILLFDVHDLNLVSGLELEEVISFLQNPGNGDKSKIAAEKGRDYCLDSEATMQAIDSICKSASIRPVNAGASAKQGGKLFTLVRDVVPVKGDIVDDWSGQDIELFGLKRLCLKLAEGRLSFERDKQLKEYAQSSKILAKRYVQRELKPGATSPSTAHTKSSNYVYFIGKFNRVGSPALWFDTADLDWPVIGSNEKYGIWQARINAMYKKSGKSKTDLCIELADLLHSEKGMLDKSPKISAQTIFRRTKDPGSRTAGGSKPKSQRRTK